MCGYDRRLLGDDAIRLLGFVHPLRHGEGEGDLGECGVRAEPDGRWHLDGEVSLGSHDGLRLALGVLRRDAHRGHADLHLDLGELRFIDAGGVGALTEAAAAMAELGRRLVVHGPPALLRRLLGTGWGRAPGLELAP